MNDVAATAVAPPTIRARLRAAWDGDVAWSFRRSPVAVVSLVVFLLCVAAAVFAPWIAPHNPFDLRTLSLSDARLPPGWVESGKAAFPLGTDDQGRDVLSAIMFGARISLLVGLASVAFAMIVGVRLGLLAGYLGGKGNPFSCAWPTCTFSSRASRWPAYRTGPSGPLARGGHQQGGIYVLGFRSACPIGGITAALPGFTMGKKKR